MVELTIPQCWMTQKRIMKHLISDHIKEYSHLQEIKELKKSNPRSIANVKIYGKDPKNNLMFDRLYIYFDSCKRRLLAGHRHVIGLD